MPAGLSNTNQQKEFNYYLLQAVPVFLNLSRSIKVKYFLIKFKAVIHFIKQKPALLQHLELNYSQSSVYLSLRCLRVKCCTMRARLKKHFTNYR